MSRTKKRIGVDVSGLIIGKHITGIERVSIEVNRNLARLLDPEEFEIAPFVTLPGLEKQQNLHPYLALDPIFNKPLMPIDSFDILFFNSININLPIQELLRLKKENGLKIVHVVHDILPITHPEWFITPEVPSGREAKLSTKNFFQIFLQTNFLLSDRLVLTSEHVLDEIKRYKWNRLPEFLIFPLGAFEIPEKVVKLPHNGINTIYVSTVAARKGHADLLDAFDLLWAENVDINLTIVGVKGWGVDDFLERLHSHPQLGKRLFWRERLLDAEVTELYRQADIAFIPSLDEGFGMVLEEGLANGLKVIARDIPVFRERSYPNLHFFANGAENLREKILEVAELPTIDFDRNTIRTLDGFSSDIASLLRLL